ncbi:Spinocerebellar ataxia type 10 protein domain [Fragilaria crotonensis]|nr:Spinocerebellar ataxia type 10 protein domain [Fragilaria crotonensis]
MTQWSEQLRLMKEQKGRGERPTPASNKLFFATVRDHLNTHADRLTGGSETHALEKEWNAETQCALRCATLACLVDVSSRRTMQELAVVTFSWHLALLRIISSPPSGGDQKSRLLAARLLTNLVTGNPTTASTVMTTIPLSPTPDQISDSIRMAYECDEESSGSERSSIKSLNWVDAMLACSRSENRDALAAVVAAIHNCIAVVDDDLTLSVASDPILISATLRHILPASAVIRDSKASAADEATEWISLFLEQLTGLGLLPTLYFAVGSSSIVTPEHLVLLQCISGRVDEWLESANMTTSLHPLGNTDDRLTETHLFLARLASRMRKSTNDCATPATTTSPTAAAASIEPLDADFSILSKSALTVVLEILATSLGSDSSREVMALVRSKLGTETDIILEAALDLGVTVDALLLSSRGVRARELKLQDEDQRWITTLVRVLGNACFRCRSNQDALRHIHIPTVLIEDHALHLQPQDEELHRTALHVLLSCTSLAYGCFTLREWSIVALRNALEGNLENQTLVEKLEAQQPLQSPELKKMGFQVDLDRQGKVKLVPTEAAAASEASHADPHTDDN